MTLRDVRAPARMIADWCLAQDDLAGFHLQLLETGSLAYVQVYLYWPSGWVSSRAFGVRELGLLSKPEAVVDVLEVLAAQAGRRIVPVADMIRPRAEREAITFRVGSKVRVNRPGRFAFSGEVVAMGSFRFGDRGLVKIRPDSDRVAVIAAPGAFDRWVQVRDCVELSPGP